MDYTIEECDRYIDELVDKMGSDYFPLPIKFGRFVTITLDFIRENSGFAEANQDISDNIKPLLIRRNSIITPVIGSQGSFQLAEPVNYHRLISIYPFARIAGVDTRIAKKVAIIKEGQRQAYERDPHRKPSPFYPAVTRLENFFRIDTNDTVNNYQNAEIVYIKKPVFGDIYTLTDRIVDLPDTSIEMILLKTADALRYSTADQAAQDNYMFNQTFGKRNK